MKAPMNDEILKREKSVSNCGRLIEFVLREKRIESKTPALMRVGVTFVTMDHRETLAVLRALRRHMREDLARCLKAERARMKLARQKMGPR